MSDTLQSGRTLLQQAREVTLTTQPGQPVPAVQVTGTVQTVQGGNSTLSAGVQTGTTVAAALNNGVSLSCTEVVIQAHPLAASNILVGVQALQPFHIAAGDSLSLPVSNVNKVYISVTGTPSAVNWLAVG